MKGQAVIVSKLGSAHPAIGLASLFVLAVVSSATAAPATTKDLSGKKICWDSGVISTFGSAGEYTSGRLAGTGTWSATPSGVAVYSSSWNGIVDVDKLPNGTFKSQHFGGVGKYCK